jgi:hypothetical protein
MAMARIHDPDATGEIDVGFALHIPELAVFGAVAAFATIAPPIDAQILLFSRSSVEALTIPREALLPSPSSYIREERFQLVVRVVRVVVEQRQPLARGVGYRYQPHLVSGL